MKEISLKMKETKIRFNFMKETPLKLTTQKNTFLIIHFNFKREFPLKMRDIKKNNPLPFYRRNPFKT